MNTINYVGAPEARQILEHLSTAVLLLDHQLQLEYINPAGEMLLAVSARRLQGIAIDELFPHSPSTHLLALIRKTQQSNHPCTEREMLLTLPDQRTVTIDCTLTPYSPLNRPTGIMIEMLPMDRHLRIARDELLHSQFQGTKELLRGLAHEIKNPLGGLRGSAQLLERELHSEELREYTQIIIDEADRLRNLVDRMLSPSNPPRLALTNIHEVLERVCSLVSSEVPAGIKLIRDYDPSLPETLADADQLIQATLNITRNAAQALNGRGTITLRTRPLRQFTINHKLYKLVFRIQIIDDGPGIPPELLETIFYPMVSGRADGTGLGLTISQTLINQHHGLIECSSRPGRTTFTLLLPLQTDNEDTPL